jgi:hypothetical protein
LRPPKRLRALEKAAWGVVPGVRWPVSFVGFACIVALLVRWLVADREELAAGRWLLRAGCRKSTAAWREAQESWDADVKHYNIPPPNLPIERVDKRVRSDRLNLVI